MHSYEDAFLRSVEDPAHVRRHEEAVGRSRRKFDVLILRDPFNLFASRRAAGVGVSPSVAADGSLAAAAADAPLQQRAA